MAKRSSRGKSKRRPSEHPSKVTGKKAAIPAQAEPDKKFDLKAEYQYVLDDLQRIGIIATILVVVLIALSFFL